MTEDEKRVQEVTDAICTPVAGDRLVFVETEVDGSLRFVERVFDGEEWQFWRSVWPSLG